MAAAVAGLPVLLCGDNDKVGRDAMLKVRAILKKEHHQDATYLFGEEKGSVADFPAEDLIALIRIKLSDRKPSWQKPGRNRAETGPNTSNSNVRALSAILIPLATR